MGNASKTRQMLRETVKRHGGGPTKRPWVRRTGQALATFLLAAGLLLWWSGFFAPPAAVAELRSLVDEEVTRLARVSRNEVPYDSSGPDMGDWFQRFRDVPEPYRDQIRRDMGRLFAARERAAVGSYFALPPAQRKAELDRRIKAEDARRQQWMAERAARRQNGNQGTADPNSTGGSRPQRPAGANGNANDGGRGRGRPRTEEAINDRRKQRLDASSPEDRARRTEYRRVMRDRREQLGLGPGRGSPGRRPG